MEVRDGRRIIGVAASRYAEPQVGVHLSRSTVVRPLAVTGSLPTNGGGIVTLQSSLRHPRAQNEYVDSPPTEGLQSTKAKNASRSPRSKIESADRQRILVTPQNEEAETVRDNVFTTQPKPVVKPPTGPAVELDTFHEEDTSIICKHCGKCRCEKCKEKRELPSVWLCNEKCHLSANSMLKACTCLWMVEGVFYHAAKDYQMDADVMDADDPCACCSRPHCFKRWMCMAAMSVCLPCLCCYWPGKCGIKACSACYNRCTNKGCHCSRSDIKGSQTKRLLESDSSSA